MAERISVRCKKDGQVEHADLESVIKQQARGFRPWTFCGFCSAPLVFPKVCSCRQDMFLLPGEACAKCGRPYDSAIDDLQVLA